MCCNAVSDPDSDHRPARDRTDRYEGKIVQLIRHSIKITIRRILTRQRQLRDFPCFLW